MCVCVCVCVCVSVANSFRKSVLQRAHLKAYFKASCKKDSGIASIKASPEAYVFQVKQPGVLKYTNKFIDYRLFKHSFTDDLPNTKIYVPWQGPAEQATLLEPRSGYLSPFKMTCHKIFFRTPAIDTVATDIVFGIRLHSDYKSRPNWNS